VGFCKKNLVFSCNFFVTFFFKVLKVGGTKGHDLFSIYSCQGKEGKGKGGRGFIGRANNLS